MLITTVYFTYNLIIRNYVLTVSDFGKISTYNFFTVVFFCTKKSNFFSSQHGRKLTNCYRSLYFLIKTVKTNTTSKTYRRISLNHSIIYVKLCTL